jgi:hypothetical protein
LKNTIMVTDTRADFSHHLPKNLQALMLASTAAIENEAAAAVDRCSFLTVSNASGFAMEAFPLAPLAPLAQTASPASAAATGLKPTYHPRHTSALLLTVHIVPSADASSGIGEPGLPPMAPAFANALAQLTGKPLRELSFKVA